MKVAERQTNSPRSELSQRGLGCLRRCYSFTTALEMEAEWAPVTDDKMRDSEQKETLKMEEGFLSR